MAISSRQVERRRARGGGKEGVPFPPPSLASRRRVRLLPQWGHEVLSPLLSLSLLVWERSRPKQYRVLCGGEREEALTLHQKALSSSFWIERETLTLRVGRRENYL